ncbi:MAG: WecB/TagA/CpsF family glycosyltransferase, partial [Verrucomicrobiota bacterium]
KWLGNPLPERVAGADLVPELIRLAAENGHRIFLLGATPEAAAKAVERLRRRYPNLAIAGCYSPPFKPLLAMDHDEIIRRVTAAQPDLLFVSFGCPKQEKWIAMHYRALGVPVCIGVGATIDFLAGAVRRAPVCMQRTGTEWLFRLAQEPRRLFKRYAMDLAVFAWRISQQLFVFRPRGGRNSKNPIGELELTESESTAFPELQSAPRRPDRTFQTVANSYSMRSPEAIPTPLRQDALRASTISLSAAHPAEPPPLSQIDGEIPFLGTQKCPKVWPASAEWKRIRLSDRLDRAAVQQHAPIIQKLLRGRKHCLLDMTRVRHLDSTGIGCLIQMQKQLSAGGRQLILFAPDQRVVAALKFMRVDEFFSIAPDLKAARQLSESIAESSSGSAPSATADLLVWQGELTSANVDRLWLTFQAHLAARPKADQVIDLSRIRFIDTSGAAMMARIKSLAEQLSVKLSFVNPPPVVRNVLRHAGLEQLLRASAGRSSEETQSQPLVLSRQT